MTAVPPPVSRAVFLSYASQDAEAARRICEALRASGVEVWFDQNELVGGDAWDGKIRRQIKDCALFMPVISANTNARAEGYFRLEWKLAVDRSHLMADDEPFLFPVVIDDTSDAAARVPDRFREVQWTRLNVKDTPETLSKRVARLLGGDTAKTAAPRGPALGSGVAPALPKPKHWLRTVSVIGGLTIGLVYALRPLWSPRHREEAKSTSPSVATPAVTAAPLSPARQLAEKARVLVDTLDSTPDDYATAEGLLKRAVELDPNDGLALATTSLLNSLYLSRGFDRSDARREVARSHAERAVKLAPELPDAWLALGRAVINTDPARSEEALRQGLKLAPDDGRLLIAVGGLYRQLGRSDEALAAYERAAAQPASRALARYDQYLINFYRRRFAEADRCVREGLSLTKTVNMVAGLALLEVTWRGRIAEARQVLADAPVAVRSQPRVVVATVLISLMARQPDEALVALDRLPADYINDAWFTGPKALLTGLAHAQAGRTEAARLAWETGLAIVRRRLQDTPNDFEQHARLGELLAWSGQSEAALREAKIVEELLGGGKPDWTFSAARIHAALGRADEAVPLLKQMVESSGNGRWPLTPALLRLDPQWDKLRGDARFQALCVEAPTTEKKTVVAPGTPLSPARELAAKAQALLNTLDATREDVALAEDYCQRALKLDPTDGEVWATAAQVNATFVYRVWDVTPERREQTRVTAERAIRLSPASPLAKVAQASAWCTFGINRAETEKLLREVVAERPDDQGPLRFLAVTVLNGGGLEECLALNERSAALPGGDPLALFNNARYLWQSGRLAEAYAMLQRSLAQKPFSGSLVLKALLEITVRDDPVAADVALQQIPQSMLLEDRANYTAGLVRFYQRRAGDAIKVWGSFPRDYYKDGAFDGPKGLIVGLADELDHRDAAAKIEWRTALQAVEKRIEAKSNDSKPYYYKAYLLACLGDKVGAIEALHTHEELAGLKYSAESPMPFDLAAVYARLGRFDEIFAFPPRQRFSRIALDPRFDALRADPRYRKIVEEKERREAEAKK